MITPEGDYLSNLQAPDLRPYFKHLHWRQMGHSMGHLVASDWADKADDDPVFGLYKKCGLWTRDEAAILVTCVERVGGRWADIGCHTGWTSAHIAICSNTIDCVDPMLRLQGFQDRLESNMARWWGTVQDIYSWTSQQFFEDHDEPQPIKWSGFVIDGDHEPGAPLQDAQNAYKHLADTGVILFHDGIGAPVRQAVTWLMDQGMKARIYWTPHIVFACWRGDFTPPDHEHDTRIDWRAHHAEMSRDFDFSRLD